MSYVDGLIRAAELVIPFSDDANLIRDLVREVKKAQPRIITTAEELEALPIGEVVVTAQGGLWGVRSNTLGYNWWQEFGSDESSLSEELTLPAAVVNVPEVSE